MAKAPPDPAGVATLDAESRRDGTYAHKTLWAIAPGEVQPTVRAFNLRTGRRIRFGLDAALFDEMELPVQTDEWSYAPGVTLIPGPGCYAFQVYGDGFYDLIVFKAKRAALR